MIPILTCFCPPEHKEKGKMPVIVCLHISDTSDDMTGYMVKFFEFTEVDN